MYCKRAHHLLESFISFGVVLILCLTRANEVARYSSNRVRDKFPAEQRQTLLLASLHDGRVGAVDQLEAKASSFAAEKRIMDVHESEMSTSLSPHDHRC